MEAWRAVARADGLPILYPRYHPIKRRTSEAPVITSGSRAAGETPQIRSESRRAQIVARHPAWADGARKPQRGIRSAQFAHSNSASSAFASLRSGVAKPSVNQP
jgi:hypothetical protein